MIKHLLLNWCIGLVNFDSNTCLHLQSGTHSDVTIYTKHTIGRNTWCTYPASSSSRPVAYISL